MFNKKRFTRIENIQDDTTHRFNSMRDKLSSMEKEIESIKKLNKDSRDSLKDSFSLIAKEFLHLQELNHQKFQLLCSHLGLEFIKPSSDLQLKKLQTPKKN